jgi:predicted nucleic acid-binding protein
MEKVLIDTDVILDFFFDRKPFSDDAAKILAMCEKKEINGNITAVILSNVYYLLRQSANHNKVIESLNTLMSIIDIVNIDKKTVMNALNSNFKDFEDALQNYAAEADNEIRIIVTRNIKDFKNSKLGVLTPENYLALKQK